MKNRYLLLLLLLPMCLIYAQEEVASDEVNKDDLGNVSSIFKEQFFDALSEKAKGNHDRAIDLLEKCEKLQPKNDAVQFELAKNYMANSAFAKAEKYLLTAIDLKGENEWLLDSLYEVYNKQQDFKNALAVMQKLAAINENYEGFLPLLYYQNNRKDDAIAIITKLDKNVGSNRRRNLLRRQIEGVKKVEERQDASIEELLARLKSDPKDEQSYINLIYLYSQNQDTDGILKTAQALEDNLPNSDKAQLALYKIYLENNKTRKALKSMKQVFSSESFTNEIKIKVLNDFIETSYTAPILDQKNIDRAIDLFTDEVSDVRAYEALGLYYIDKKQPQLALTFYDKGLSLTATDFELIKKTALLSIDVKDFEKTKKLTASGLELFPAQPLLYLLHGVSLNKLNDAAAAITILESGLAYLLDEPRLERDMYSQLAIAYTALGKTAQATAMESKAQAITKKLQ